MDIANVTAGIRVDAATSKGSVIDVIKLVNPGESNAPKTITRLPDDLIAKCSQLRINGKGKLTPCADARTLVEIIWSLPGKAARDFRRESATTVCRVLGGDLSLVQEIENRHHALQESDGGRAVQEFLVPEGGGGEVQRFSGELPVELQLADPAQKSAYFNNWMHEKQKRSQLSIVREGMEILKMLDVRDERDSIMCGDMVRRIMSNPAPAMSDAIVAAETAPADDPTVPTPECHWAHRGDEMSMHTVASEIGVRIPRGKEGLIGKAMKRLYSMKYGLSAASKIPKRNVPFHGQVFAENCYWTRDKEMMVNAIHQVCT